MSSIASDLRPESLLFSWDPPRRQSAVLASFLVLSLVTHALCFYVFQIVYPPPVALLPPPARVTFISPDSEQGRTMLRWIDAEDPAIAFTTHPPPGAKTRALPKAEHVPSYSTLEPALKDIPPLKPDLRIPSSRPPGAVRSGSRKPVPATPAGRTLISFSKEFDQFGAPTLPRTGFVASNGETPETLRFRVAVNRLGEVRYCFAMNSSGDPALDEQARFQIVRSRFSGGGGSGEQPDSPLVWGVATIQWGSDVTRPQQATPAQVSP
jgi:hypothetical protein